MDESGKIEIRRATRDDADVIAEYAMKLVEQHVGYDPVRFSRIADRNGMAGYYGERTAANNAAVLVVENGDKVIGFAYLEYEPILYAELAVDVAWLHDIYVDAAARGRGAGKLLMNAVREEAKRLGAGKVLLSVAARNAQGKEFFEHSGYTATMQEMMLVIDES
jgi:GNAT superfamily N-acetyltransferase